MTVYSMTGFASTLSKSSEKSPEKTGESTRSTSPAGAALAVELRSVNGRFLDLVFKLPEELRGLEPGLRDLLGSAFRRGKIEMRVATQREVDSAWPDPNPEQLNRLSRTESTVRGWLPEARPLSVNEVMNWCRSGTTPERLDDAAMDAARRCVDALREARSREGAKLVAMLTERTARLRELAAQAEPLIPAVVKRQQERFLERWNEALSTAGAGSSLPAESLRERALNEATAFAIRIDVAEELSRLRAHLDEIERLLKAGGELGKRLDFLIQELHREANTMGSKSAALELTGISVEMKVLIEQMREQVQNLE
jgi:uncharacterized protein (TIGR00255 family)